MEIIKRISIFILTVLISMGIITMTATMIIGFKPVVQNANFGMVHTFRDFIWYLINVLILVISFILFICLLQLINKNIAGSYLKPLPLFSFLFSIPYIFWAIWISVKISGRVFDKVMTFQSTTFK